MQRQHAEQIVGRGLILGLGWGVLVSGIAMSTLSVMYSNNNHAPVSGQVANDAGGIGPSVGATETPTEGASAPQTVADETILPVLDTPEISTDTPDTPQAAEGDASPASRDVASIAAPDITMADGSDHGSAAEMTEAADLQATAVAPVTPSENSAMPVPPQGETRPALETQNDTMTAPTMQNGPEEGDAPAAVIGAEAGDNSTADVQAVAPPTANAPDPVESPEPDHKIAKGLGAPDQAEPETVPEPESRFAPARVPVAKMTNLAPNVRTNRLPSIGGPALDADADVGADIGPDADAEAVDEATPEADLGALKTYATGFENPDAKPMFSIILVDDPQNPLSDDVLSHLPFPLSFAIDAVRDDAAEVAARYRAAGFEVLMLTNLPFGASATDVEVAFGAYSRAIPQAIGVLDLGTNGFLRGPSTATQIAGILSEGGFGLITPSQGLNSAQKAAMREGVPAVLLFRELDSDGENPSVMRRYLDRAAFRAAQKGSVIMLGHTGPDTIEALVTWALEDRAASVAIAPVSAVLLAQ